MAARSFAVSVCLGLALVLVSPATPARAQAPDYEAASAAYKRAEAAFAKKEWAIAAREYGDAYAITKDPILFYKIAQSHDRNGDCNAAVVYYRRFLKEGKPDSGFRAKSERAIERCTGNASGGSAAAAGGTPAGGDTTTGGGAAPAGDTDTTGGDTAAGDATATGGDTTTGAGGDPLPTFDDEPAASWKKTAAWVSVGATVAFVTTGAVLGLSASSRQEDIDNLIDFRGAGGEPATFDGSVRDKYEDLVDEGEQLDVLSKVAFGVAGASAVAAVVFFVLDGGSSPADTGAAASRRRITPMVGTRGEVGVRLGWQF